MQQGQGELQSLLHAGGKAFDPVMGPVRQPYQRQALGAALLDCPAGHAVQSPKNCMFSTAESFQYSDRRFASTTPMHWRTCWSCVTALYPQTVSEPLVGIIRVESILMKVVFPAPLGPSSPKISPWYTWSETPFTATVSDVVR